MQLEWSVRQAAGLKHTGKHLIEVVVDGCSPCRTAWIEDEYDSNGYRREPKSFVTAGKRTISLRGSEEQYQNAWVHITIIHQRLMGDKRAAEAHLPFTQVAQGHSGWVALEHKAKYGGKLFFVCKLITRQSQPFAPPPAPRSQSWSDMAAQAQQARQSSSSLPTSAAAPGNIERSISQEELQEQMAIMASLQSSKGPKPVEASSHPATSKAAFTPTGQPPPTSNGHSQLPPPAVSFGSLTDWAARTPGASQAVPRSNSAGWPDWPGAGPAPSPAAPVTSTNSQAPPSAWSAWPDWPGSSPPQQQQQQQQQQQHQQQQPSLQASTSMDSRQSYQSSSYESSSQPHLQQSTSMQSYQSQQQPQLQQTTSMQSHQSQPFQQSFQQPFLQDQTPQQQQQQQQPTNAFAFAPPQQQQQQQQPAQYGAAPPAWPAEAPLAAATSSAEPEDAHAVPLLSAGHAASSSAAAAAEAQDPHAAETVTEHNIAGPPDGGAHGDRPSVEHDIATVGRLGRTVSDATSTSSMEPANGSSPPDFEEPLYKVDAEQPAETPAPPQEMQQQQQLQQQQQQEFQQPAQAPPSQFRSVSDDSIGAPQQQQQQQQQDFAQQQAAAAAAAAAAARQHSIQEEEETKTMSQAQQQNLPAWIEWPRFLLEAPEARPPPPPPGSSSLTNNFRPAPSVGGPPPTPTGRKKALLIGVQYASNPAVVASSGRNVAQVKDLLLRVGFEDEWILVLSDSLQESTSRASYVNIIVALRWLAYNATPGDALFFHFSGHGSHYVDVQADQTYGPPQDDAICPEDVHVHGVVTENQVYELLLQQLPAGVRLTALMDCCVPTAVMELPFVCDTEQGWLEDPYAWHVACDAVCLSASPSEDLGPTELQALCTRSEGVIVESFLTALQDLAGQRRGRVNYLELLEQMQFFLKQQPLPRRARLSATQLFDPSSRPFRFFDAIPNGHREIGLRRPKLHRSLRQ